MKSNLIIGLVIVICTAVICLTIKTSVPEKIEVQTKWEYQVANGSLGDGKWLKGFGDKGWELIESTGDGAFIFKRPAQIKTPGTAKASGV